MKLLILISYFLIFAYFSVASASEITGKISTDPNNPGGHYAAPVDNEENNQDESMDSGESPGGGSALIMENRKYKRTEDDKKNKEEKSPGEIKVLGIGYYPDGSLLRGSDKKIYLIKNGYRKYIANLEELKKYASREIIDVGEEDLKQYEYRPHLDGELIRQIGDVKVYVIENGLIRHIKSLEELRARYFGLEIYNLKEEEMSLYD